MREGESFKEAFIPPGPLRTDVSPQPAGPPVAAGGQHSPGAAAGCQPAPPAAELPDPAGILFSSSGTGKPTPGS